MPKKREKPDDMVKKLLSFTPKMWDMVQDVKEAKGYVSYSAVIHQAIIDLHSKTYPAYAKAPSRRMTADEKIREKEDLKQAEEKFEQEKKVKICQNLGGSVTENEDGSLVCNYFTYSFKKRFEQNTPISMLSEDLYRNQYSPSKEEVLKLQEQGKVEY